MTFLTTSLVLIFLLVPRIKHTEILLFIGFTFSDSGLPDAIRQFFSLHELAYVRQHLMVLAGGRVHLLEDRSDVSKDRCI